MALFFINQNCSLCNKEMNDTEKVFSFPTFIQNAKDPYYQFNDSVFHMECLKIHLLGHRAIGFAEHFFLNTRPENRICIVSKKKVLNFDDYIFIDLLTSYKNEELYDFRFITLDRNNLTKWEDRNRFITAALKFKRENKWGDFGEFKYLDDLINRIEGISY